MKTHTRLIGLFLVTSAALLFGLVAVCIKALHMPVLLLQLCRSTIEWIIGIGAALAYQRVYPAKALSEEMPLRGVHDGQPTSLIEVLFGQQHLRKWIFLRALLYWCFLVCWWSALNAMPLGDATAIVYVGPVFTALFGCLLLGERIDWSFFPVAALDMVGSVFICQPSFLFPGTQHNLHDGVGSSSAGGVAMALCAAIAAGMLPICTRKSKSCPWIAINHCSSLLSMVVFTPLAILIWTHKDPTATVALGEGFGQLVGVWPDAGSDHVLRDTAHLRTWLLLLGATLLGYVALAQQTLGYQMEQVSRASIMTVLEIPFSYLFQVVIFGKGIEPLAFVGAGLILCGTVLNIIRRIQQL